MLTLPSDSRFDSFRTCGWVGDKDVPPTHTLPAGRTPLSALLPDGALRRLDGTGMSLRGATDAFGYPKSILVMPGSLYGAFGKGTSGGQYGYSWADAWVRGTGFVGQDFLVEFEDTPSPSHFYGKGRNAFDVRNALLKNVHVINADCAVFLRGSYSHAEDCSTYAVDTDADGLERTGVSGHYGFKTTGDDTAFVRCRVRTKFQHDFSVELADRTAFVDCSGPDAAIDFHANKEMCHWTLHYRTNVGKGSRLKNYGGNIIYLPHAHEHNYFVDVKYGSGTLVPKSAFRSPGPDFQVWNTDVPAPPLPPTEKFAIGDRVKTTTLVYVRQYPSKTSALLGSQATGKFGTVTSLMVTDEVNAILYRQVNFDTGADGYVDETKLVRA